MNTYQITTPDRTFTLNMKREVTHAVAVLFKVNDPNNTTWAVENFTNRPERAEKVARANRAQGHQSHIIEATKV